MNRKENTEKLVKLRTEIDGIVAQYNDAAQNNKLEDVNKLDSIMANKIGEYTSVVREMCFEECRATEDPMLTAIKMLSFETIGIKDEEKGDDKIPVRTIVQKERQIDLYKLDAYCHGIGVNKNWNHIIMKLNYLLTAQKCLDLGIDVKAVNDSYAMSDIARQYDMGKNPTSKTNLLKTLQTVVSAMIGDKYKATSHDVNYLLSVYSRKSRKALTVVCANHKYLRNYLAEICHRIVVGKSYSVDYKKTKDSAKATPVHTDKKTENANSKEEVKTIAA